jgi:hypothetical protein
LAAVARRLKIIRKVGPAFSRVFTIDEMFRGVCRVLHFEPDVAKNESLLAKEAHQLVPDETLLLGVRYFEELPRRKLWGVFRWLKVLGDKH